MMKLLHIRLENIFGNDSTPVRLEMGSCTATFSNKQTILIQKSENNTQKPENILVYADSK